MSLDQDMTDTGEELRHHAHACLLYETEGQWYDTIIPFLNNGLKNGEKCLYIAHAHKAEDICGYLEKMKVDCKRIIDRGQILFLDKGQSYVREGFFDPENTIEFLRFETQKALDQGYSGLRASGEMSWVLEYGGSLDRLIEYEDLLNSEFFPSNQCVAICQYDMRLFNLSIIRGAIETHPLVVSNDGLFDNFYYLPPEPYKNPGRNEVDIERWLKNLGKYHRLQHEHMMFIESTPDMVFLKDKEFKYLIANRALSKYFRKGIDEIVGKTDFELMQYEVASKCRESDIKTVEHDRLIVTRERTGNKVYETYKFHVKLANGDTGIGGYIRDITLSQEYLDDMKKYGVIFRNANDMIFIVRASDLRVLDVNRAVIKTYGYSREEALKLSIPDFTAPGNVSTIDEQLRSAYEDGAKYETLHKKKDGSIFPVEVSARFIMLRGEEVILGIVRDNTERKNNEEIIKKSMLTLLNTLSRMVETKDPYTAGHQRRVSQLACAIAERLNLGESRVQLIRIASMLHDIGKISIPGEILSKPGKLSKMEFDLVKLHPVTGYDLLKEMSFDLPVATIVKQHHERLDGSGYPDGLKGDEITLEARIIAVADVVEAMSTHRPYLSSRDLNNALNEIAAGADILFDRKVVQACIQLFEEKFTFSQ
jgi:PAS domain S-box-containing protein/putative nucleotidyltransferase with HDIG domain